MGHAITTRTRSQAAGIAALAVLSAAIVPSVVIAASAPAGADPPATTLAARLRIGAASQLIIGSFPTFTYDGRAGQSTGTITDRGNGQWTIRFPADTTRVPPLPMVSALPDLPVRVLIESRDLIGTLDVCARTMSLAFDAKFTPEVFGNLGPQLSVVTPLDSTVPVDATGRTRLEGTALVPRTGDLFVDAFLDLPNNATAKLAADLDVGPTGELPACPGSPAPPPSLTLELGPGSMITMGAGPLPYDAGSTALTAPLVLRRDGRYDVAFATPALQTALAPIRLTGQLDLVGVDLRANTLSGTFDPCTRSLALRLAVSAAPWWLGQRLTEVPIRTTLRASFAATTDSVLIGIARVRRSDNLLANAILGLAATARFEFAAHLDVVGAPCRADDV